MATEHSARIHDPGIYKSIKRSNDRFGHGVHVLWGIRKTPGPRGGRTQVQAIHFDAEDFTPSEARDWLEENDYDPIKFSAATRSNPEEDEPSGGSSFLRDSLKVAGLLGLVIGAVKLAPNQQPST